MYEFHAQNVSGNATDGMDIQRVSRRCSSTQANPPPAGGHLPSVATSAFLKPTRDVSLRTSGLRWVDSADTDSAHDAVVGRETRKMNMYQAVRDALRYADVPPTRYSCLTDHQHVISEALRSVRMILLWSLAKTSLSVVCSDVPW